jgi:hypothetical protein
LIGADAALLGVIGVVLGALLSQRGARRVAGEDRLWARRADLYLQLLDWLRADLALFEEGERRHKRPWELVAGLEAFGTEGMDRAVRGYDAARADAAAGHRTGRQQVLLRANWLRLTVRHELAALPSRGERWGLGLVASRPVYGPVTRLRARLDRRAQRRARLDRLAVDEPVEP